MFKWLFLFHGGNTTQERLRRKRKLGKYFSHIAQQSDSNVCKLIFSRRTNLMVILNAYFPFVFFFSISFSSGK